MRGHDRRGGGDRTALEGTGAPAPDVGRGGGESATTLDRAIELPLARGLRARARPPGSRPGQRRANSIPGAEARSRAPRSTPVSCVCGIRPTDLEAPTQIFR